MSDDVDYRIETIYVQTGTTERPGGQQAGMPHTGIRITHEPTGTMAYCALHRSQHRNRKVAMEMIEWALTTS